MVSIDLDTIAELAQARYGHLSDAELFQAAREIVDRIGEAALNAQQTHAAATPLYGTPLAERRAKGERGRELDELGAFPCPHPHAEQPIVATLNRVAADGMPTFLIVPKLRGIKRGIEARWLVDPDATFEGVCRQHGRVTFRLRDVNLH